ncbi:MAG TPA: hypothetical protein VFF79_18970 [Conexibacter sp.]|nr:hypothetical protein [Conexibacter sp.]
MSEGLVASFAVRMNVSRGSGDARDAIVQRIEAGRLTLADPTLRLVVVDGGDVDELF